MTVAAVVVAVVVATTVVVATEPVGSPEAVGEESEPALPQDARRQTPATTTARAELSTNTDCPHQANFPPFGLPLELASTYCDPSDLGSVISAANACVHLLEQACVDAAGQLGMDLLGPLSEVARRRLTEATDIE